jgi:hypothetical protein
LHFWKAIYLAYFVLNSHYYWFAGMRYWSLVPHTVPYRSFSIPYRTVPPYLFFFNTVPYRYGTVRYGTVRYQYRAPSVSDIYHHDKDDDSITENTIHEEDFLGKLKGEVWMLDYYFNYFNRIFFYLVSWL